MKYKEYSCYTLDNWSTFKRRFFYLYFIAWCCNALSISKHLGGDIYTWGWGGANGTFFEEGHSSGGQLVSYLLSLQLLVLHDDDAQHT